MVCFCFSVSRKQFFTWQMTIAIRSPEKAIGLTRGCGYAHAWVISIAGLIRRLRILDAFSRRHSSSQAPAAIWISGRVREFQLFLVIGLPVVRRFLTGILGWEAGFYRARTWFGGDQSPAQKRQRSYMA